MAVTQPICDVLRIDLMSMAPGSYSEDVHVKVRMMTKQHG